MRHLFYLIVCMELFQVSYFTPCFGWGIFSLMCQIYLSRKKLRNFTSYIHLPKFGNTQCYFVLGEELFWRGFVQNRLSKFMDNPYSILIGAILYASVQIYSGTFIHIFSALFAGLFWGFLYSWKRSIPLVVVSHLIFDLFIFIAFPFR